MNEAVDILDPKRGISFGEAPGGLVHILEELWNQVSDKSTAPLSIKEGDKIILIPLYTSDYHRLGFFILWAPADRLEIAFNDSRKRDWASVFRTRMEQLMIRLFTNFYHMTPETYLPSYFRQESKHVALICTEIRGFDHVAQILRQRHDWDRGMATKCLQKLVNRFSEVAAGIVEKYEGRIDQIWGNGLLAIFGQYSIIPENGLNNSSKHAQMAFSCMYAAMAAADIIEQCTKAFDVWLSDDFLSQDYLESFSEHISLHPIIAIDYGDVMFDYIGSRRNRFYMAVGDHVNFVRQLADVAGRTDFDASNQESLLRQIRKILNAPAARQLDQHQAPPILLSQPAFVGAKDNLKFIPGEPANWEHHHRTIRLPGKSSLYSVYEIWPDNVTRTVTD
jgi:class 3 adenylate cyclase